MNSRRNPFSLVKLQIPLFSSRDINDEIFFFKGNFLFKERIDSRIFERWTKRISFDRYLREIYSREFLLTWLYNRSINQFRGSKKTVKYRNMAEKALVAERTVFDQSRVEVEDSIEEFCWRRFRRGNWKRGVLVSRRKDETIIAGTVRRHRFNARSADL